MEIRQSSEDYLEAILMIKEKKGYVFSVDIEQQPVLATQVIKVWQDKLAPTLDIYLGHNVKFDL